MGRRGGFTGAPDRWINYTPIKDVIKDIKIVPFKVPLPISRFSSYRLVNYKWTPADVLQSVPDLGLVIDLTFKYPCYYEPVEFLENGVDYVKIGCEGHVLPSQETFNKFCSTIDDFLRENPDLVVGVHCTHGVNRTGYMICRYMVERHGYTAEDALRTFAEMRGYEVERQNYCDHLRQIENRPKSSQ